MMQVTLAATSSVMAFILSLMSSVRKLSWFRTNSSRSIRASRSSSENTLQIVRIEHCDCYNNKVLTQQWLLWRIIILKNKWFWENLRSWFDNRTNYCLWELGQRPSITQQTRFWNSLLFCWRNIDGIHDSLDRLNDLPGSDCVLLKLGLHGRLGYKFLWDPWSTFLSHHCATIIRDHVMIKTNQNKIPTVRFYLYPSTCFSLSSFGCLHGWITTDPSINAIIDYCEFSSLVPKNVRYSHLLKSTNLAQGLPLR